MVRVRMVLRKIYKAVPGLRLGNGLFVIQIYNRR